MKHIAFCTFLRNVISIFQVEKVISTQFGLMRADQQAALAEASNSSCKTFNPIPENVPQPGPSGLSGRASKTEHSITGKFLANRYKV